MKKLVVYTGSTHRGGLDTFTLTLLNQLSGRFSKISLVVNSSHPALDFFYRKLDSRIYIKIYRGFSYLSWIQLSNNYIFLKGFRRLTSPLLRPLIFFYSVIRLSSLFRTEDADLFLCINGGHPGDDTCRAAVIAWNRIYPYKPALYNYHNYMIGYPWYSRLFDEMVDKIMLSKCEHILTVSRSCAASLAKYYPWVHVKTVYNGIMEHELSPTHIMIKDDLNIDKSHKLVLMLATYEERKGHAFVIESFSLLRKKLPDVSLVFAGYGDRQEVSRVTGLISKSHYASDIYQLGYVENPADYIYSSDLLVVGSQNYESFGLTAVEAMSAGTPVVSTDIDGLREVLGEGNECLVSPDRADLFAEKMGKLLTEPAFRDMQITDNYNRYKENFTVDKMTNGYLRYLSL